MTTVQQRSPGDADHDPRGRFKVGNKAARGGAPFHLKSMEYRRVLFEEATKEDMRRMARVQINKAIGGSTAAWKDLANRLIGRPILTEPIEPLQLIVLAEQIMSDRVDAIRSLRLAQARGENLDLVPADDPRTRTTELASLDVPAERRRVLREIGDEGSADR